MILAVDAMGGDHAPQAIVAGVADALQKKEMKVRLYGPREILEKELAQYSYDAEKVEIVHCTEVIEGEDSPIRAVRRKKDSSLVRAVTDVKEGVADAVVSAGNTGALITAATLILGRMKGLGRPALTTTMPTEKGTAILLDIGANAQCKSEWLYQFAVMGSFYAQKVCDVPQPKVALMNIGTEAGKGNDLAKEAYALLAAQNDIDFIGNIESRRLLYGDADVIVTDGFTGNVMLKLMEGTASVLFRNIKQVFYSSLKNKLAALMVKGGMKELKRKMDYKEYGGAPVLGVNGIAIKAHGSSDRKAFSNALTRAAKFVESGVIEDIRQYFEEKPAAEEE